MIGGTISTTRISLKLRKMSASSSRTEGSEVRAFKIVPLEAKTGGNGAVSGRLPQNFHRNTYKNHRFNASRKFHLPSSDSGLPGNSCRFLHVRVKNSFKAFF